MRAAKIAVTGAVITPLRAVFIEVENGPELREFRQRLYDIVGASPLIPPHVSLRIRWTGPVKRPSPISTPIAAKCAEAIDDADFSLGRPVINRRAAVTMSAAGI